MKRRDFIQLSALGGLTLPQVGLPLLKPGSKHSRISVPLFEWDEITIEQLRKGLEEGKWSCEQITKAYLQRIRDIDQSGPRLRSVIEVNPDAIEIARELDRERAEGVVRGPLHGIPIMIKDNIETGDKMLTSAGSLALSEAPVENDAFIVKNLRQAGMLLLGKTNLSEWANFRSNRSSSGWSSRGGQTRNPYITDRNPCGSSSGSGVAVSANLCAIAIGTETNGSIVCPANNNGIVGIKPTLGLWSRSGIVPIAHSHDTAGPMARTVADAALLLGALTGVDQDDPATLGGLSQAQADYTQFLDPQGLQNARIGIGRSFFGFHEKVDALMEKSIEAIKSAGAEMIELDEFIDPEASRHGVDVLYYEFKNDIAEYLAKRRPSTPFKTLADLIAYNKENMEEVMPFFGQERFLASEAKGNLDEEGYVEALKKVKNMTGPEGIDKIMDKHRLDAIIAPTGGPAWPIDPVNGDHFGGSSSSPAAWSGYPNITVPNGFIHGLPVGISFFGRAWSEAVLIRIAYAFEQLTMHRKAPMFLPTLPLE